MRHPRFAFFFPLVLTVGACSPSSSPPGGASPPPTAPAATAPTPVTRLDELLAALRDYEVQAIYDLEKEADASWLPELRDELVKGPDFFVREGVASTVVKFDGLQALPLLLEAQRLGRLERHDNDGLDAIIMDLIERDKAASYAVLRPMVQHADPTMRAGAAWLLAFVRSHANVNEVIALTADTSADVRSSAIGSLPSFPRTEQSFALLTKALDDPAEEVRIAAIWALGRFGDKRAVPLLQGRLGSASEMTRHPLNSALEKLATASP
jgi:HEAT repeat protein